MKQRAAVVLLAFSAAFAACARSPRRVAEPAPAVAAGDSVGNVNARADSVRRADSTRTADSLRLRADSIATRARLDSVAAAASRDSAAKAAASRNRRPAGSRECVLDWSASPPESRLTAYNYPDGSSNSFIGGGFTGTCQGQNNTIRADSAEFLQTAGILNLIGNVRYEEPTKIQFSSDRANYFTKEERLFAEGNVVAKQLTSGSTFTGPTMEYFRARPGVRNESRLFAPGRPSVRLTERDTLRTPPPPVVINANVIEDRGDSVIFAWGAVIIDRGDIQGAADSASYDKTRSEARLIRKATVVSRSPSQSFRLTGDTVQMFNKERQLERVVALHDATVVNGDLTMTSENVDMRLKDQKLKRAFAYGKGRSLARTPQQQLEADSMAIYMNEQRVREVHALGAAMAVGQPDTLRIISSDRDMLRGDTIFARFDTVFVPGDTTQPRLREIESRGNASSLYQIASKLGRQHPPSINYARGRTIFVTMDSVVRSVRVDSSASGYFLEPEPDSLADSTAAKKPAKPIRKIPPTSMRPVLQPFDISRYSRGFRND